MAGGLKVTADWQGVNFNWSRRFSVNSETAPAFHIRRNDGVTVWFADIVEFTGPSFSRYDPGAVHKSDLVWTFTEYPILADGNRLIQPDGTMTLTDNKGD